MNRTQLTDLTRSILDEPEAAFWTDEELYRWLNEGLRQVYSRIAREAETWFLLREAFTYDVTNDQVSLDPNSGLSAKLSKEPLRIRRVEWLSASGPTREVEPLDLAQIDDHDRDPLGDWGYIVDGTALRIRPRPTTAPTDQVRIYYVPVATTMASDTDSPPWSSQHHEVLAYYAAVQALKKREAETRAHEESYTRLLSELIQDLGERVSARAHDIQAVPEYADFYRGGGTW